MIWLNSLHLFVYLVAVVGRLARASTDGKAATDTHGSFKHPASIVRPRFRYWLPDGGVDADAVAADISSAASIGAGGVEFLPFFEYGGSIGPMPPGANWSIDNFGTKPFRKLFKTALEAHEKHGLVMDFALGPNQGQGVPANQDDEGLQWDLVPHTSPVPHNGSFTGVIPGWGTGKLVALVSALILSNSTLQYETLNLIQLVNVTYDQYVLSHTSLVDHTTQVSGTGGTVQLSFPPVSNGSHYRIFSFFEKRTLHKNLFFTSPQTSTIFDNGSYVVDHFSSRGAATTTRFWDQYMLKDGIAELITKVGNYAWEDSPEFTSNISWSPSIPSRFEKKFGYSLKPFMPLLTFKQNNIGMQSDSPGSFECVLDTPDAGQGYVNDFRSTLTDGYSDYVKGLSDWAKRALGVQVSVQPGYGLPIDVMEVNPGVNAPECESLAFKDTIDTYRKFVGPANLAGRKVISNELGAIRNAGFRYTIPELLWSANRGFAGGVNQFVMHGQAYTGDYYATTWPGHVAFAFLFSEPWSEKQPVWAHGLDEALGYMSRMQYIQQAGVPKIDVAIYNKESATSFSVPSYRSDDLLKEGWTYNYLTSENLLLQQASVSKATLAPTGPAYRALVIESSQNVTVEALRSLQNYAKAGLPIIFSGGFPSFYPSGNGSKKLIFNDALLSLSKMKSVHHVAPGQVASKLSSLQIEPRVRVVTNGTWYTTWREACGVDYIMVFADTVAAQGTVTVQSSKKPFFLNPWTGDSSPVIVYQQTSGKIIIPLNLNGNQTIIIAFADKLGRTKTPAYHVAKTPANVLGAEYIENRGIALHVAQSKATTVSLSNGKLVDIDSTSIPSKFEIPTWSLVAEHWEAPANISEPRLPIVKFSTTHKLPTLTAWRDITALSNSSGIGYYSCKFQWPHATKGTKTAEADGAYLLFSRVLNTLQLQVNGHKVPPLDPSNAAVDLTPYLQTGENEIVVIVPTTWWNYLRTILTKLTTAGSQPLPLVLENLIGLPIPPRDETGLVGTVTLVPYRAIYV